MTAAQGAMAHQAQTQAFVPMGKPSTLNPVNQSHSERPFVRSSLLWPSGVFCVSPELGKCHLSKIEVKPTKH